jgi:hypothetical protein
MHNLMLGWEPYVAFLGTVLAGYAVYVERRKRRYPSHITCYTNEVIPLVSWITRSLPDLSIQYQQSAVGESTLFLSAYLVHSGHKDITPDMVEQRLTLTLPEGYRWIAVNVGDRSHGLKASCNTLSKTEIEFDLGLFRVREYVEFVALIDLPEKVNGTAPETLIKRALEFRHRITDTSPVDRRSLSAIRGRNHRMFAIAAGVFVLTLLASSSVYFDLGGVTRTLGFYRVAGPGMLVQTDIYPNGDGSVSFVSDDGVKADHLRGEQLTSQYKWNVTAERSSLYPWVALLFTIYFLLTGALLGHQGWKYYHFAQLPYPLRRKHA